MSGHKTIEWYERQLETNTKLTPSQIEEYESEIERLADIEARAYNRAQQKKAEERKRFEELKAEFLSKSKDAAIAQGLAEFGNDYEIRAEGSDYVVYSKVARDFQQDRRVHKTEEDAKKDLDYLIYNRMYDKYVRSGDYDSLKEM